MKVSEGGTDWKKGKTRNEGLDGGKPNEAMKKHV
jgi:hypothetical protein